MTDFNDKLFDEKQTKTLSKLLSKILRHNPDMVKISLDKQGFTDIDVLIDNIKRIRTHH